MLGRTDTQDRRKLRGPVTDSVRKILFEAHDCQKHGEERITGQQRPCRVRDALMYVCMYVRMYVCTYVCMYVCMYVFFGWPTHDWMKYVNEVMIVVCNWLILAGEFSCYHGIHGSEKLWPLFSNLK